MTNASVTIQKALRITKLAPPGGLEAASVAAGDFLAKGFLTHHFNSGHSN